MQLSYTSVFGAIKIYLFIFIFLKIFSLAFSYVLMKNRNFPTYVAYTAHI